MRDFYVAEDHRHDLSYSDDFWQQMRARRALLSWKQRELAAAAGLSEVSIKNAERGLWIRAARL
jgi:DNA-binding XRE family transcriptional regulator